jgi:hypothetical protein
MPRHSHDFYETPPHYLQALFAHIAYPARVYEPCVGKGAIADYLVSHGVAVRTNDIDHKRWADTHLDVTDIYQWEKHRWCITNPPFRAIDAIVGNALGYCRNVVTLARLSFLEPTVRRRALFEDRPPRMVIVLPRYCFRLNDQGKRATDSVTCAWVGWGPDVPEKTVIWTRRTAQQLQVGNQ